MRRSDGQLTASEVPGRAKEPLRRETGGSSVSRGPVGALPPSRRCRKERFAACARCRHSGQNVAGIVQGHSGPGFVQADVAGGSVFFPPTRVAASLSVRLRIVSTLRTIFLRRFRFIVTSPTGRETDPSLDDEPITEPRMQENFRLTLRLALLPSTRSSARAECAQLAPQPKATATILDWTPMDRRVFAVKLPPVRVPWELLCGRSRSIAGCQS